MPTQAEDGGDPLPAPALLTRIRHLELLHATAQALEAVDAVDPNDDMSSTHTTAA